MSAYYKGINREIKKMRKKRYKKLRKIRQARDAASKTHPREKLLLSEIVTFIESRGEWVLWSKVNLIENIMLYIAKKNRPTPSKPPSRQVTRKK